MSRLRAFVALLLGVLFVAASLPALAQDSSETETETETAAQDSSPPEVEISDVVVDRYPDVTMTVELRNIQSLDPAELIITEDGVPVVGAEVITLEESTTQVGIVLAIDTSGSMAGAPIEAAKQAALSFVDQKRLQDAIAVITFDNTVSVLSGFTTSPTELSSRIEAIEVDPNAETAFFDAVVAAAEIFQQPLTDNPERNLIILTDGKDTVADDVEVAKAAAIDAVTSEPAVRVFGVALEGSEFDPSDLQDIVAATSGLYRATPDLEQLDALYGDIRRELNNKLAVRFTGSQTNNVDVEFGVEYQGLRTSRIETVPGYVPTTTVVRESTTTTALTIPGPGADEILASPSGGPIPVSLARILAALGVGVALALFIIIVVRLDPDADDDLVSARLRAYGRRGSSRQQDQAGGILGRIPLLRRFSERAEEVAKSRGLLGALNSALEQGNIPLRPGEAMAAGVGLSLIAGVFAGLVWQSFVYGAAAFVLALLVVVAVVQLAGTREKRRFEDQLPDTLTLVSTSLRAGYSLLQAVEAVAAEAPDPTSREFGRAIAESRLGRPVVQSLEGIADRMRSPDFEWAVMAIEIQREVGGNLAEVLQIVAETMLQRNRLRREVKALTAEGRISAIVLGTMPIALFFFLLATNRTYLQPLIGETVGIIALVIGLGLMAVGALWLRRITTIEV